MWRNILLWLLDNWGLVAVLLGLIVMVKFVVNSDLDEDL